MKDSSNSEAEWGIIRARQIGILRLCRLPLLVSLLVVGVHGGVVTFEHLGWSALSAAQESGLADRIVRLPSSDPQTSTRELVAEPRMGTDVDPAGGTGARTVGRESVSDQEHTKLDPDEISSIPGMSFAQTDESAGDTAQEFPSPVLDSTTRSEASQAAEQVARDLQSWVERDLTGAMNGAKGVADSSWLLFRKRISRLSDSLAKTAEDPKVSPGDEGDTKASPNGPAGDVVLLNPKDTGGVVRYLANGEAYSLSPGETQNLGSGGSWLIQFHLGADFGNAEYTLSQGVYAFQITESGWDLQRASLPDFP